MFAWLKSLFVRKGKVEAVQEPRGGVSFRAPPLVKKPVPVSRPVTLGAVSRPRPTTAPPRASAPPSVSMARPDTRHDDSDDATLAMATGYMLGAMSNPDHCNTARDDAPAFTGGGGESGGGGASASWDSGACSSSDSSSSTSYDSSSSSYDSGSSSCDSGSSSSD